MLHRVQKHLLMKVFDLKTAINSIQSYLAVYGVSGTIEECLTLSQVMALSDTLSIDFKSMRLCNVKKILAI